MGLDPKLFSGCLDHRSTFIAKMPDQSLETEHSDNILPEKLKAKDIFEEESPMDNILDKNAQSQDFNSITEDHSYIESQKKFSGKQLSVENENFKTRKSCFTPDEIGSEQQKEVRQKIDQINQQQRDKQRRASALEFQIK